MPDGSGNVDATAPAQGSASPKAIKRLKKAARPEKKTREQSTIAFPYQDLDAGIALALAIFRAGNVGVTREQLAGILNMSQISGGFLVKVAAARLFGIVASVQGKYEITNLGFSILDSDERKQRQARAEAFLSVPLYRKIFEEFRGKPLPPRPAPHRNRSCDTSPHSASACAQDD